MRASLNTPPRQLRRGVMVGFWMLAACYLATGLTSLGAGIYYRTSGDTSRRTVVVTDNVAGSFVAAGVYIVASAAAGIFGSLSLLNRKLWLTGHICSIILAMLVETSIGMWMWYRTLDVDEIYGRNWRTLWPKGVRRQFQEKGGCCGYLNPHDSPVLGTGGCKAPAAAFGCMVSVQEYAQGYLTYVYTWLFVFVLVAVTALLSAMVLMAMRNDEERLRWSRANAIFRSLKTPSPNIVLRMPEPKPAPQVKY
ncbi:hypothetical protein GGF46_004720 [Coemansia sp. RSA 552]|nr:hypothetical protein GGF46_004720 [Coemansia sp. RSA 552]